MEWSETVDLQLGTLESVLKGVRAEDTERFLSMILEARKIFVVGRGRTGYIVGTFAMRLMHLGFDVHVVGDCTTPRISEHDLLVACSGSGRVRMVIQMAQIARRAKARIAFVTYNPSAPTPENGDLTVLIPTKADRDRPSRSGDSLQPLGTLFEEALMLYLDLVVAHLMDRNQVSESEMARRHTNLE
jgi:6-phospho-3-hexuloisomerase